MRCKLRIFAEGKSDRDFFLRVKDDALLEGVCFFSPQKPEHGGTNWVLDNLVALIKASDDADAYGLVLDADQGAEQRWQGIRYQLAKLKEELPYLNFHDLPAQYPAGGFASGDLGVWLTPGLGSPGNLENLKLSLITSHRDVLDAADEAVKHAARMLPHQAKATFGTWLAWLDGGRGRNEDAAWASGLIEHRNDATAEFVAWVRKFIA
jgi:hypothetical protein